MAASSSSPCGACKFLRRKCAAECLFAPYFPPDQPIKFANAHKIFGASNIAKILNELPQHQRAAAVNSLAYEAQARMKDPVYGCVGAISYLKHHIELLEHELRAARSELAKYMETGLLNEQRLPINLQAGTSDHDIISSEQAIMADHAGGVFRLNDPNLSSLRSDPIWLLGSEQQPVYHDMEFIGNLKSVQLARAGHFGPARTDGPMDGRSTISAEGTSNISSLSSP